MAIFFFHIEIKEFIQGELSNIKQAMLPIVGAVGGMLVPALIYVIININDQTTLNGWAVPSPHSFFFRCLIIIRFKSPSFIKSILNSISNYR